MFNSSTVERPGHAGRRRQAVRPVPELDGDGGAAGRRNPALNSEAPRAEPRPAGRRGREGMPGRHGQACGDTARAASSGARGAADASRRAARVCGNAERRRRVVPPRQTRRRQAVQGRRARLGHGHALGARRSALGARRLIYLESIPAPFVNPQPLRRPTHAQPSANPRAGYAVDWQVPLRLSREPGRASVRTRMQTRTKRPNCINPYMNFAGKDGLKGCRYRELCGSFPIECHRRHRRVANPAPLSGRQGRRRFGCPRHRWGGFGQ